ncbi:MAG: hypothetical protein ACF8TS_04495, partial [Maioricimonas sp. JB049]
PHLRRGIPRVTPDARQPRTRSDARLKAHSKTIASRVPSQDATHHIFDAEYGGYPRRLVPPTGPGEPRV